MVMAGQVGGRELSSSMKLLPGLGTRWPELAWSTPVSVQASAGLPGARAPSLCKSVPRLAHTRFWYRRDLDFSLLLRCRTGRRPRYPGTGDLTPAYRRDPVYQAAPPRAREKVRGDKLFSILAALWPSSKHESVCGWASTHVHHTDTDTHTRTHLDAACCHALSPTHALRPVGAFCPMQSRLCA